MDFLVNSIASEADGSMLGVVLTHFDTAFYTSRAEVKLHSTEEFVREYRHMQPMGFSFDEKGVLLSDTVTRRAIASSVFSYMEQECSKFGQRDLDIVDLVLYGVENNGLIIANFGDVATIDELKDSGIFIPFKNFKVSRSSFNIYSSYQNKEGRFRTYSLLTPEDGGSKEIIVAFPATVDLETFPKLYPKSLGVINFDDSQAYVVYSLESTLLPYYAGVGEAFLNYLAYNVAFYNIGEETLEGLAPQMKLVTAVTSDSRERAPRRIRCNVGIDHCYRECQLKNIVNRLGDIDSLNEYISTNPEAYITYQWIRKAYNSPWFNENTDGGTEQELLAASCMNLLLDCRRERLKYALELLDHRYYIFSMGMINDTLNIVLKGGGVDGEAVKRSDFGYN